MSDRQRRARRSRRAAHRRSAGAVVGGGLVVVGSLVTGAVAQAGPTGAHVEVFSDSGAAAAANAGTQNYGDGSAKETLADAITFLNSHGGGTITFSSKLSGHTIDLGANLPFINDSTKITGLGAGKLAVSGGGDWRSFIALSGADLSISGLTVENMDSSGVYAVNGDLTVTGSVIKDNIHTGVYEGPNRDAPRVTLSGDTIKGNHSDGVYIANVASLKLSDSLVADNFGGVLSYGGGPTTITGSSIVDNGISEDFGFGGVAEDDSSAYGPLTIVNSTISGNALVHADDETLSGGGIEVAYGVDVDLVGDTVTDNRVDNISNEPGSAAAGGGISMGFFGGARPLTVRLTLEDSVVAGNRVETAVAGDASYPDVAIASGVKGVVKDSLIGAGKSAADTFTKLTFSAHDQEGTTAEPLNPKLGKLKPAGSKKATAGGALEVQKPEQGSPLIGKGAAKPFSSKATPFTTDELGTKRPSKGVTIGAYQVPAKKKHKRRK